MGNTDRACVALSLMGRENLELAHQSRLVWLCTIIKQQITFVSSSQETNLILLYANDWEMTATVG